MIKKVTNKYDVGQGFINVNDITDSMNVYIQAGSDLQKCALVAIRDVRLLDMNTHTITPEWTKEPSVQAMAKWGLGNPRKSVYVVESTQDLEDLKAGRNLPVEKKGIQFSDLKEGMYVLIKNDLAFKSYNGVSFVPPMAQFKGKLIPVQDLRTGYFWSSGWCWSFDMISKIIEIKPGKQFTLANNDYYDSWDDTFEKGDIVTIKDVQKRFYDDITLFEVYTTDRDETRMVKLEDLLPAISVGDKAEIVDTSGTSFHMGEIVTIMVNDGSGIPYYGKNVEGRTDWLRTDNVRLAA